MPSSWQPGWPRSHRSPCASPRRPSTPPTRWASPPRSPTSGASSTCSLPARTRRRVWPPSSRSARPTSRADRPMALGNPDRPVGGLAVRPPVGVELRPLARDDFEVGLRLIRELYGLPDTDPAPHRPRFDALIADPDAAPFLALADGEAAGMILFRFRRRLNHATFEGWVSDLVVSQPFRGRGIGRALLAAAIAEWRLRGGHQVMLEVGYERTVARSLYEAMGFVDKGKYFEIGPIATRAIGPGRG